MFRGRRNTTYRIRTFGLNGLLLIAMLATTLLPAAGASASSTNPGSDSSNSLIPGGGGFTTHGGLWQGRETPTSPPPPPRETPTSPPPPPRYTPTNTSAPRRATPTSTQPPRLVLPSATPTPTSTFTPPAGEAPPVFAPPDGTNTLTILGCDPQPNDVKLSFRRIDTSIAASGESIPVPVQQGNAPGLFVFTPPSAQPGGLFALDLHINSPDCPTGEESGIDYWTPGSGIQTTFALPGSTSLVASSLGKDVPGADKVEFKMGGEWKTDLEFSTTPKNHFQTFKWSTNLPNVVGGKLQASIMPFPSSTEGDLLSPPGLVAEWDVTCGNCNFSIDASSLAFDPPESSPNQASKANFFQQVFQAIKQIFQTIASWIQSLFSKQSPAAPQVPVMTSAFQQPGNLVNLVDAGKYVPPLISTFYFRIVPLYDGNVTGAASNPVRIQWYGEDWVGEALKKGLECQQNPGAPGCPTPVPPPLKPYIVEITGYHGIIAPQNGHQGCYLVTKDTTINQWNGPHTYHKGDTFCPPKPKEKSWYEAVVDFVVDAVNWVSAAYNDLKDTVISIVANFVPDSLCSKACLGTLLDAGLMALGIPPSIPNFDQLMNEGLDYLASQAAAQLGVPQEVYDALPDDATQLVISQAEEAWKAEAEKQIKQGLQQGLEAAHYALSESVSWIPDGVPVKPDPYGDYQPTTLMLKVTRDPTVPLEANACAGQGGTKGNLFVYSSVVVDAAGAKGFNDWISSQNQLMQANYPYYLFQSTYISLPVLGLGESQVIPVVLKPTINDYWGNPWTSFADSQSAWSTWYWNGQMNLSVSNPCSKGDAIQGQPNMSFGQ